VQTHAGSWWEHALGRKWAAVERSQRAEAEAAALHAMSFPAVVVCHDMKDGRRALQTMAEGATAAVCAYCRDYIDLEDSASVFCVSGNAAIHLTCAKIAVDTLPAGTFNIKCSCCDPEIKEGEEGEGTASLPGCVGYSVAVVRKLDQKFEEAEQQKRIDYQMKFNAALEARPEVDHRPTDSLPWVDQTVIAINVLGLPRILQEEKKETEEKWLTWFQARSAVELVVYTEKGDAGVLCVQWPTSAKSEDLALYVGQVEALLMSFVLQVAEHGDDRAPTRGQVIRSQKRAGGGVTTFPLFVQLVQEASQLPKTEARIIMVGGKRHRVRLVPDAVLRVLGDKIDEAAFPPFLQQLTDATFDTMRAMKDARSLPPGGSPRSHADERARDSGDSRRKRAACIDVFDRERSSSNDRGGQGGSEVRARYTAALLISVDYLLTGEHMPYSSHTGDSWQPTNDTGRPAAVGDIIVKARAVATTKQPGQGDAGYVAWSLSAMPVLTRWLMRRRADLGDRLTCLRNIGRVDTWHGGGDEKKCREVGTDAKEPLKSVSTGSCGGMRSERLGKEEEKRCEVGRDVKEPLKGGPMGGRGGTCSEWLATDEKKCREVGSDVNEPLEGGPTGGGGGMHSERLGTEEEKRYVGSRPETTRAGEDLLTVVKTNLPMPWAIGKRFVILALILLHFCGGAQALHLPMRGLPAGQAAGLIVRRRVRSRGGIGSRPAGAGGGTPVESCRE
jgi:hypothetical protein